MTNKTPIQELIDHVHEYYGTYVVNTDEWLQKEKAFAFDCYQAGYSEMWSGDDRLIEEDFDLFYTNYAEQHNE